MTQSLPVGSSNAKFAALRGSGSLVRACSGSVTRQLRWDLQFLRHIVTRQHRQHSGAVLAAADCVYGQRDSLLGVPRGQNTNGSALTDLGGFKISYGTALTQLTNTIALTNPGLLTYVVIELPIGTTYYFAVIAVTTT